MVELVLKYYEELSEKYRRMILLKCVFITDPKQEWETGVPPR